MNVRPIARAMCRPMVRGLIPSSAFDPLTLFANGEQGAWYDPSDLTTLYQDSAGTTPVTIDGDPVGLMLDKSGNGNHASQATSGLKPIYRTDGTLHWLEFDGVDDTMSSASVFTIEQGQTILAALSKGGGAGETNIFGVGAAALPRFQIVNVSTGSRVTAYARESSGDLVNAGVGQVDDMPPNVPTVLNAYITDAVLGLRRNGDASTTESPLGLVDGISEAGRPVTINGASGSQSINFYSGIYLNRLLSLTEITGTEQYLATKSGVTL